MSIRYRTNPPVRFSISSETLNNAAKTGSVPPMPTGISDKKYDLRRLRQGYLYILAAQNTWEMQLMKRSVG